MVTRYRTLVYDSARWESFVFRSDDIVISTPPKCGTTWTQMLCALLVFDSPEFDRPLARISPWLDMQTRSLASVVADLEAQTHRRFIKTHTPLDGLPFHDTVTYLCVGRDPRDVAMSWAHHAANMDPEAMLTLRADAVGLDDLHEIGPPPAPPSADPRARFWEWALDDESPTPTLARLLRHLETFWARRGEANIEMLHYHDLTADLSGQMRRLADTLRLTISDQRINELATAATFDQMKKRAVDIAPNSDQGLWRNTEEFFHRGESGQWRNLLDDVDLARYDERVSELVPPDLAVWSHQGWLGSELPARVDPGSMLKEGTVALADGCGSR